MTGPHGTPPRILARTWARLSSRQRGFTLLEVLVSVLVLSIGLLGIAGLQLWSLRYNTSAYQSSQAGAVVADLVDRMRANPAAAAGGSYVFSTTSPPPAPQSCVSEATGCNPTAQALHDIREWREHSLPRLGQASASVAQAGNLFTITVSWKDRAEEDKDGAAATRSMTVKVRL